MPTQVELRAEIERCREAGQDCAPAIQAFIDAAVPSGELELHLDGRDGKPYVFTKKIVFPAIPTRLRIAGTVFAPAPA